MQREGRIPYVLAARIEPDRLARLLQPQEITVGGFATLVDGRRAVIARSTNQADFLGRQAPGWFFDATVRRESGLVAGPSISEEAMLFGFHRLRSAPTWTVVVAAPEAAYAQVQQAALRNLALGAAVVLPLGLLAALGLSRRLLRPVDALAAQAASVATAESTGPSLAAVPPARVREFEALRRALARADTTLRGRESRLRELISTLDLGAFMASDPDGVIQFWSKGCERLYGWTAAEAVGRRAQDLLHTAFPDGTAGMEAAFGPGVEWAGDLRQWTRDGRALVVSAVTKLRRDEQGRPAAVLEIVTDVTAQRAAEAALAQSEARFRALLDGASVKLWVNQPDGAVDTVNATYRAYTGDVERPRNGSWIEAIHPQDRPRFSRLRASAIAAGEAYDLDYRLRRAADGAWR